MKTDPPHILCVNPWIHDFGAFDFWLKPLGLLGLAAQLRAGGAQVSFMDCLDRFHPMEPGPVQVDWDGRGPFRKTPISLSEALPPIDVPLPEISRIFYRYGIVPEWFIQDLEALKRSGPPDLILVTSLMTYWASGVAETIACIRRVFKEVPIVLGGRYATLCTDHARAHSGADRVVPGQGEALLAGLVKEYIGFDLQPPEGEAPFPALDLCRRLTYAPILTSRGCPFSCEYCASSFLDPKPVRRPHEAVFREIRHWHTQFGIRHFAFYDDALLVNGPNYAFPLLEKVIASGMDLNFHTPNAMHIREIDTRAADLLYRSGFKNIRFGLETADFSENRPHDAKVKAGEFTRAVAALRSAGFKRDEVGTYLLCGLPGQDPEEVASTIRFVREAGIRPVLAHYTPIPHTPMWEKAKAHARMPITSHPVFTGNCLFPCVLSDADIRRISQLKNL